MLHTLLQVKYPVSAPGTRSSLSRPSWYLLLVCLFSAVCGLSVKVVFLQLCQQSLPLRMKEIKTQECVITFFLLCLTAPTNSDSCRLFQLNLGAAQKIHELEADTWKYWKRLRKENIWRFNRLHKGKKF